MRLHHVNVAATADQLDGEVAFLRDTLGLVPIDAGHGLAAARWFQCGDGLEIHLSEDPLHVPALAAHVAISGGDELDALEGRIRGAGLACEVFDTVLGRLVFCTDPAGNRWELRRDARA